MPAARSRTRSPRPRCHGLDHGSSPAALDPGRHQVVGEVVALGHGVEHATYVGRLLVQVSAGHAPSVGVRTPVRATRGCPTTSLQSRSRWLPGGGSTCHAVTPATHHGRQHHRGHRQQLPGGGHRVRDPGARGLLGPLVRPVPRRRPRCSRRSPQSATTCGSSSSTSTTTSAPRRPTGSWRSRPCWSSATARRPRGSKARCPREPHRGPARPRARLAGERTRKHSRRVPAG